MTDAARRARLVGYAALLATVAIWGAWIVLTRQAVTHSLSPSAIALLRMIAPTILLAPAIWRAGIFARGKIVRAHPVVRQTRRHFVLEHRLELGETMRRARLGVVFVGKRACQRVRIRGDVHLGKERAVAAAVLRL